MRKVWWFGAVLTLVVSCSAPAASEAVELFDGRIEGPTSLNAGSRSIEIENRGGFQHTLVITDANGEVVAATDLVDPGEETALDVDLAPGTYVFSCRIVVADENRNLFDHFEMGMNETVRVSD